MKSSERKVRRIERLREELHDSDVHFDESTLPSLLLEVDRARFPARHERRFPSYGAIVSGASTTEMAEAFERLGAVTLSTSTEGSDDVRRMADGVQSFAHVRPEGAELILLTAPVVRELELVQLRRNLGADATVVRRSDDGTVRVFDRHQIVIFDGTRWWTKPDANEYTLSVRRLVPSTPPEVTASILDFCVHSAGPGAGGTTLVWCLDAEASLDLERRSVPTRPKLALHLPLDRSITHSAIRHLVFQVDGAAALDPAGNLIEIGLHLRPSTEAHRLVRLPTGAGTRHGSALRCSYDVASAVFFVVSEDGPVTVYHDGRTVASIDLDADEPAGLTS